MQNIPFPVVAKGHVLHLHSGLFAAAQGGQSQGGVRRPLLQLAQKFPDAANARHGGLDALNFHADALQRSEHLAHVGDDRHGGSHGHAEQFLHPAAQGGAHHHHRHHQGTDDEDDGGINRIIKIRLFHSLVAVLNGAVIAVGHVPLLPQGMDHADAVDGLRDVVAHPAHRRPVLELRGQHPLLERPGHPQQQGRDQQHQDAQSPALHKDDRQDAEHLAHIHRHAHDTGGKQGLHGVHISHEPGGHGSRLPPGEPGRGQARQLGAHGAPQGTGQLLAQHRQQKLLTGVENARQGQGAEVQQCQGKGNALPLRQAVYRLLQHQGRRQAQQNRPGHRRQQRQGQGPRPFQFPKENTGNLILHVRPLPSGHCTNRHRPGRFPSASRGCPPGWCPAPSTARRPVPRSDPAGETAAG